MGIFLLHFEVVPPVTFKFPLLFLIFACEWWDGRVALVTAVVGDDDDDNDNDDDYEKEDEEEYDNDSYDIDINDICDDYDD